MRISRPVSQRLLATWGWGEHGRLGHGDLLQEAIPKVVGALSDKNMLQVSCGQAHVSSVDDQGSLYTFGLNMAGQLGRITPESPIYSASVEEVLIPEAIKKVKCGGWHTLALSETGKIWSFGSNYNGQLGIGRKHYLTREAIASPNVVTALSGCKVSEIAVGLDHSLATLDSGEVLTWGSGLLERLGHGQTSYPMQRDEIYPRQILSLSGKKVKDVSAGALHSGCIDDQGDVYIWGANTCGQLGLGQNSSFTQADPTQVFANCTQILFGMSSTCVLNAYDGHVFGENTFGVLGLDGVEKSYNTPVKMNGHYKQVALGWAHAVAISMDDQLYSWGWTGLFGKIQAINSGSQSAESIIMDGKARAVTKLKFGDKIYENTAYKKEWKVHQVSCGFSSSAAIVEIL